MSLRNTSALTRSLSPLKKMSSYLRLTPTSLVWPISGRRLGFGRKVNRLGKPSANGGCGPSDQRLGDGRRAIAFREGAVDREAVDRRDADRHLGRKMVAARLVQCALELVVVVAQRADHLEPAIIALPLRERARHRALAVRRRDLAVAGPVGVVHLVAEQVAAHREGVAEFADVEARGVVGVEALGVDLELARVADEAGDRIAEAARRAVEDLGLVLLGRGPVDVAVEIEDAVVRQAVAIAAGQRCCSPHGCCRPTPGSARSGRSCSSNRA